MSENKCQSDATPDPKGATTGKAVSRACDPLPWLLGNLLRQRSQAAEAASEPAETSHERPTR